MRTLALRHRDDLALHIARKHVPRALVDHKRRLPMGARIRVRLRDDPRGGVGDAEVQHLALHDELVQAVHDLLDGGGVVPPVQVQHVDVGGAQLLQ